jgi:hypothetical protein
MHLRRENACRAKGENENRNGGAGKNVAFHRDSPRLLWETETNLL